VTDLDSLAHWRYSVDDSGVGWLLIDRADEETNSLGRAVMDELDRVVTYLEANLPKGLVLMSGKSSGFIVGADIREFDDYTDVVEVNGLITGAHELFQRFEDLGCYKVVAIDGFCLGGGLELALCCDYLIATDSDSTRIGLPEIKLGIFPGFGGSVRLTRRIGGAKAMPLMLTGRFLKAGAARKARPDHYPAPFALIESWRAHAGDRKAHFVSEAAEVAKLAVGDTARGLRRVFHLMEDLKRTGKSVDFDLRRVHVIGAGVMGGDIAAWCVQQGLEVTLQDREMRFIEPAIKRAHKQFARRLKGGALVAAKARLIPDLEGAGVRRADVVIEAIIEDAEIKRTLFKSLEPQMRSDAVLATNTSSIPLEELTSALENPSRLIGLHFFNPVAKMPLLEVVRGAGLRPAHRQAAAGGQVEPGLSRQPRALALHAQGHVAAPRRRGHA